MALLETSDRVAIFERMRNLVLALEQTLFAQRLDIEMVALAIGTDDGLAGQVDGQRCAALREQLPHQGLDGGRRQAHRQEAVLQRIAEKDIAEIRRDYRTDAEGDQSEYGRLPRRADAEIAAGDRDHGAPIGLLIEDVVGLLRAVGIETP